MNAKPKGFIIASTLTSILFITLVLHINMIQQASAPITDDDSRYEYGVEWINEYPWPTKDLSRRDNSAKGLKNKLVGKGWSGFEYSNSHVYESDFDQNENSYVDTKDIVLFTGHGSSSWDYTYSKRLHSALFSGWHDDRHLLPGEVRHSWGERDLEWLAFEACKILEDRDEWAATMNDIHLLLGFKTEAYDYDLGYWWAEGMVSDGNWDPAEKVKDAWVWAAIQVESGKGVVSRVIGQTWGVGNDYLWGQGTGPTCDDAADDDYYYYWDNPINCIKAQPAPQQSTTIPTYVVVPKDVTPAYVMEIASRLGMTGAPVEYNDIYYMADGSKYLEVSKTEGILFGDSSQLWKPTSVEISLPTQTQARAVADNFLNAPPPLMPPDASWYTTVADTQSCANEETGVVYNTTNLDWQVFYRRTLGDYSAVGPGARLRVFVGSEEQIIGFYSTWRQVVEGPPVEIIPEPTARSILFDYGPQVALGGFPMGEFDDMVVDSWTIGYFEDGFNQSQASLTPVYIYNLNFTLNGNLAFTNEVSIPAVISQLPPIADIVAPLNNSTCAKGDTATFQANTTTIYGIPPFTYSWSSDVDDYLGSGSTLSLSNLNVSRKEGQPSPHTITLTVTDVNGLSSKDQIALTVLLIGDFDGDGDVDIDDLYTLAKNYGKTDS